MTDTELPKAGRVLRLASTKQYDKLEEAWMEALRADAAEPSEYVGVLEILAKRGHSEMAETLLWMLLETLAERSGDAAALDMVGQVAPYLPASEMLREQIAELYRRAHADFPRIENLVALTVSNAELPLPRAVDALQRYLQLPPGAYVLDRDTLKAGRVLGGDPQNRGLAVEFEAGKKVFDAASLARLEPLSPDDFRARAVFENPSLKALAEEEPAELIAAALRAFGGRIDYAHLKVRLKAVVAPQEWARWWAKAKRQLKRSPLIEMTPGSQPTLILRKTEISFSDRVRGQFDSTGDCEKRAALVLEYLDEGAKGHHEPDPGLIAHFAGRLEKDVEESAARSDVCALAAAAALSEIAAKFPGAVRSVPSIEALLGAHDDLEGMLLSVTDDRIALCILDAVERALPEAWPEVFAACMPGASPKACERIAAALIKSGRGEKVDEAAEAILRLPAKFASALTWLWKARSSPRFKDALSRIDPAVLGARLLSAADSLGRAPDVTEKQHSQLAGLRTAVAAKNFAAMRRLLASIESSRAAPIRDAAVRNAGLSDSARIHLVDMIMELHPDLFARELPPWEEDVIYTTAAGLRKFEKEYDELVHVKIADNSRAIGEAASHGDLSENAEWTAALETRDRLTEKAARMRAELAKARIIAPGMSDSETVTVGSRVKARDLGSGETITLTFLGPWDADPDAGVYSYRAPLSLAFMGKRAGDIVTWSTSETERRYEILEVEAAY